jgi:hypothetical protein
MVLMVQTALVRTMVWATLPVVVVVVMLVLVVMALAVPAEPRPRAAFRLLCSPVLVVAVVLTTSPSSKLVI